MKDVLYRPLTFNSLIIPCPHILLYSIDIFLAKSTGNVVIPDPWLIISSLMVNPGDGDIASIPTLLKFDG